MKKIGHVLGKVVCTFVLMASICFLFPESVRAEWETGTAGSSLGKETGGDELSFLSGDAARAVTGWKKNSVGWWYDEGNGNYPALSWRKIDGKWYYFNDEGYWVDNNTYETGSLKGIDVSEWQGVIDWQAVKDDGIQFAFVRAGGYGDYLDLYFERNMKEANAVGLPVGVYFYSTAQNESEAISDAQFVIEHMTGYTVSYPVVIDLEDADIASLSKTEIANIARAFCDEVSAAGYTPMIYTNENWYTNKVDMSKLTDIEKWVARYNNIIDENIPRAIWQCCSTGRVAGIEGNVDINFGYKDFTQTITPRTEPAADYQVTGGSWVKNSKGWWYRYRNGSYPANKWETISGKKYWFDANGYMVTGWKLLGNKWYYFSASGAMQTGWKQVGGYWYYFDGSGAMATGWLNLNGTWYYLNDWGGMAIGWRQVGSYWYYFNGSGAMVTGWLNSYGTWYYLNDWGGMATGWRQVGSYWYYFNGSGAMVTGWLNSYGTWYYLNDWGGMATGWRQVGSYWYYFNGSGAMVTGWLNLNGIWYYLNDWGGMATGSQLIGNTWYYFNASGAMQ